MVDEWKLVRGFWFISGDTSWMVRSFRIKVGLSQNWMIYYKLLILGDLRGPLFEKTPMWLCSDEP